MDTRVIHPSPGGGRPRTCFNDQGSQRRRAPTEREPGLCREGAASMPGPGSEEATAGTSTGWAAVACNVRVPRRMPAHVVGDPFGVVHGAHINVRPSAPRGGELGELHRSGRELHRSDQRMKVNHAARLWTMGPSDLHVRAVEVFREIPRPPAKGVVPDRIAHGSGEGERAETPPRRQVLDKLRGRASECPSRKSPWFIGCLQHNTSPTFSRAVMRATSWQGAERRETASRRIVCDYHLPRNDARYTTYIAIPLITTYPCSVRMMRVTLRCDSVLATGAPCFGSHDACYASLRFCPRQHRGGPLERLAGAPRRRRGAGPILSGPILSASSAASSARAAL